jgi:hypothetical protein
LGPMGRRVALALCMCALPTAFGALLAHEALSLGPLATPELIGSYHFGSEAMVGNGGQKYRTRELYVASTFLAGVLLLACPALAVLAAIRSSRPLALSSMASALLGFVVMLW